MMGIALLVCLVASALAAPPMFDPALDEFWVTYKQHHSKQYNLEEEKTRRLAWEDNIRYIQHHNLEADLGHHSFRLGINEYADLTNDEYLNMMTGLNPSNRTSGSTFLTPANLNAPDKVDWREEGYVTAVKNQGHCGSCWAFATTGSLEGQHFKATGKLVSLSEQNLVDCSTKNHGCKGGLTDLAFEYIIENHGIDTEESYPYMERDGPCRFRAAEVGATMKSFTDIRRGDEEELMQAVASVGPISIGMDAGHRSFQLYKSGVYSEPECSTTKLDHGVTLIGYGKYEGTEYWLVKNSWGTSWGMDGFFMIRRNHGNECGVATQASYPHV